MRFVFAPVPLISIFQTPSSFVEDDELEFAWWPENRTFDFPDYRRFSSCCDGRTIPKYSEQWGCKNLTPIYCSRNEISCLDEVPPAGDLAEWSLPLEKFDNENDLQIEVELGLYELVNCERHELGPFIGLHAVGCRDYLRIPGFLRASTQVGCDELMKRRYIKTYTPIKLRYNSSAPPVFHIPKNVNLTFRITSSVFINFTDYEDPPNMQDNQKFIDGD